MSKYSSSRMGRINPVLSVSITWLFLLNWFLFLSVGTSSDSATVPTFGNESDYLALLDFKNKITNDPLGIMSSWNTSLNFCNWTGVICNLTNQRVIGLILNHKSLVGSLPPSIGNLTFLTELNLRNNSFQGEIPEEVGRLQSLNHLNLSYNGFVGRIPTNLSRCTQLTIFTADYNELVGEIPDQLKSLSKLFVLSLGANNLTGSIPGWLGNFSSLYGLSLALNGLQGSIPNDLGRLSSLGFFQLYGNQLSGRIPSSIYNISSIYYFSVTQNQLHGQLPPDIGISLPNLQVFAGGVNDFTGPIPVSLPNASGLVVIDFAENRLTGPVPINLGSLQSLIRLNFDENRLGNMSPGDLDFVAYLANCTSLMVLGMAQNRFVGDIPGSIANLSSQLSILTLGSNRLRGSIPTEIQNLVQLSLLGLEGNLLTEYGMGGQVSILGDVYSFGILLLEMFTGKRPTDQMFQEGLSISKYAASALPEHVMEIGDPYMLLKEEAAADQGEYEDKIREKNAIIVENQLSYSGVPMEEFLVSVMKIGLACSRPFPRERMKINHAVNQLIDIRDAYNCAKTYNGTGL
ncbi:Leucine-rich repeat-containing N-terminal, plant-type [Dillenia turbinata]|uniref:Leucine-rich repeat-containing N-terminal, plant-type n=1 Tax=Dillenia turbinata TaxID=194707 RepID=A0AAN8W017_9MAGN